MSTKTVKTPEELEAEEKAKAEKEAKKAEAKAEKEAKKAEVCFDPKKLSNSGNGIWKYNEDPDLVNREVFKQQRAKDFGIKPNDLVHVVLDGEVKTIGV